MKEFLKNDTVTYNLMSFTGYKTLVLFSLLTEGPKSYHEVSRFFAEHPFLHEKISLDTLRVYINSFRHAGCIVKRIRENGVSKYYIPEHPFKLNISDTQKKSIIKIYKTLIKNLDAEEIIMLDMLLLKLSNYIDDYQFVNDYKKVSVLNKLNSEIVRQLLECCNNKKQIIVSYNSPNSGIKDIELQTKRLVFNSNKLYVRARGLEYNQDTDFLVNRIVEIKDIHDADEENKETNKEITVTYKLKINGLVPELNSNEKLLEIGKEYATIELSGNNLFYIKQRLLEHGNNCTILEPDDFKQQYIELLKEMREEYNKRDTASTLK